MRGLKGKNVLVTGGASGIGQATAARFLEEGCAVCVLDRSRSPNLYSPHKDPERIRKRRDDVLERMWSLGMISEDQYSQAKKTPVEVRAFVPESNDAPYFVDYLVKELEKEYSLDLLTSEGMLIFTTLDVEAQNEARSSVTEGLKSLETTVPSLRSSSSDDHEQVLQACLVAIEPQTGFIRAMVGGRDYRESQFNRVVQARRQPGGLFSGSNPGQAQGTRPR